MITRCFLVASFCLFTIVQSQYVPLSTTYEDNDCALYLSGPGRSSAFDYNLNLLRGSFGYDGQHTCITYDAVNAAYLDARKRINVATPKGDWKTEDIASVGELMLDISISLARTYGLTYEDIEKGLPLIDTSKTLIREVCPPFLAHVECRAGKYRRFDGLCTNLEHPTWGATMTPFQRLIAPLYADGINAPRISVTGRDLPPSRVVSRTMHPDEGFHDHAGTVMVIAWGQFMDHDYTLTATPLDPINRNDPEECCNRPPHAKHPYCNELRIPDDDYFYRLFNVKCIDFVRGFPSPRAGCRLGSRQQFNTLTGVLDGNTVYGVTEKFSRKLRSGYGGLLRMNPVFEEYGLKDLLPLKLDVPDEGCTRPNGSMYCFEAGEIRVNEQLVLTCMHTLMAREHNRVARGLAEVNPHWDDETLFQEARRIVIAEIQHITYNEFLPILLGKDVMDKFGLLLQKDGYWDGYDSNVNPSVIDAFSAAAFRFGHSLLPTAVERWSKAHKFIASKRLSDLIRRPFDLYRAGIFDEYLMGLMNQVAQAMDDSITQEVTNHLFKKPGQRFGMDLVSFNMQRGREFGVPGYMEFRKFCGLPGANTFLELFGSMPNETVQRYESIFEHPSDVDLWSGGVSERPLPGSMLGPTFACIIATQFSYSRRGDRFWYELPNQPSSFTPEQLTELRKARLSRIICDNTDIIDTVQVYPMVLPDHEINPRVPCRSGIIPTIDFTKWADYGGHQVPLSNPYENETLVFYKDDLKNSTANFTVVEELTNKTENETSTRQKRNVGINLLNTRPNLPYPILNDMQAAALVVNHISGDKVKMNRFIPTTPKPRIIDHRDETAPQLFSTTPRSLEKIFYRGLKTPPYYINPFNQVSLQGRRGIMARVNGIQPNYNYRFIPDRPKPLAENPPSQDRESLQPDSSREIGKEEYPDNQIVSEDEFLGSEVSNSDENSASDDFSNKPTDESEDLNKNGTISCVGNRRTRNDGDSPGPNEKLSEQGCTDNSASLERVDENKSQDNIQPGPFSDDQGEDGKQNPIDTTPPEILKQQFEFIPVEIYKNQPDNSDGNKKQNFEEEEEKEEESEEVDDEETNEDQNNGKEDTYQNEENDNENEFGSKQKTNDEEQNNKLAEEKNSIFDEEKIDTPNDEHDNHVTDEEQVNEKPDEEDENETPDNKEEHETPEKENETTDSEHENEKPDDEDENEAPDEEQENEAPDEEQENESPDEEHENEKTEENSENEPTNEQLKNPEPINIQIQHENIPAEPTKSPEEIAIERENAYHKLKEENEKKYYLDVGLGDTRVHIDDIKLPKSIFGLYKGALFENLKDGTEKYDEENDDEDSEDGEENENTKNDDRDDKRENVREDYRNNNREHYRNNNNRKNIRDDTRKNYRNDNRYNDRDENRDNNRNVKKDDDRNVNYDDSENDQNDHRNDESKNENDDHVNADYRNHQDEIENDSKEYHHTSEEENDEDKKDNSKEFGFEYEFPEFEFGPGYQPYFEKLKKSEKLRNDKVLDGYVEDPNLRQAVSEIVKKSEKTAEEVGNDGNYFWTLEYGQPLDSIKIKKI